ncbi:MAG TPA: protein-export chaperone SecB [Patescibacteria group bacterium]|nr:protein-export chaperone SecB [Patescibacteria group bacterium]
MAKDKKDAPKPAEAGAAPAQDQQNAAQQPANAPGVQVIAQYIKDFSFENPNAPESLVSGWPQPETNVQIFLRHNQLKDDVYECTVNFRVEAKAKEKDKVCFIIDLSYGALVVLKNIPKENHQPVIMVEVPKLLFPFAREIVANVTSAGGYPPLFLTPISFETIYINEVKRLQEQQKKAEAQG